MRKVLVLGAAFALAIALFISLRGSGGTLGVTPEASAQPVAREASQGGSNIPDCPTVFSSCVNVAHKKCGLRNPVTTDTGNRRCRQPDGSIFQCAGPQRIHVTTQSCVETLLEICCVDGTCDPPPCGTCTGGSQAFFCQ